MDHLKSAVTAACRVLAKPHHASTLRASMPRARSTSLPAIGAAPMARGLHVSARWLDFGKDMILGTNWPEPATPGIGLAERRSGWFGVKYSDSALGEEDTKRAHAEYDAAVAALSQRGASCEGFDALAALGFREPWFGERRLGHAKVIAGAVERALERGGTVAFYLGHFCMHRHFLDALRVEVQFADKGGFARFLEFVTLRLLSPAPGSPPDRKMPTVTSVELAEFFEGSLRAVDLRILAPAKGWPLRTLSHKSFGRLYASAVQATRSSDAQAYFREHGKLPPDAENVVAELQRFVHGQGEPLGDVRSPAESKAPARRYEHGDWF